MICDANTISVIAPNLKRRLSGVTSTVIRLVPLQARKIAIAATGPVLPASVPLIPLHRLLIMSRHAPGGGPRVWHARRNIEMLAGLGLKHLLRKDLKLMFTSASQRKHTCLTRWLIAQMDAVVATSALTQAYLEVPSTVIHHGIDTDTFAPSTDKAGLRARLGLPVDALLIGCYGRIRPSKGTDIFVEAMLDALRRHPSAIALVMGRAVGKDKPFMQALRDRVAGHRLTDRLRFLPEVPADATAPWYAALDLYVAPQRHEGFGLTPLEAAACGVPSIATRTGAFAEIVAEDITGTVIPTDDTPALIAALDDVLSNPARLSRWQAACRPRAQHGFRIADEAQSLIGIYRSLLAGSAA